MNNIDENKLKRQLEGIEKWKDNKGIGTLNWFTGVGKTYGAILIINRILRKNPALPIIVIVPGEDLKKQWDIDLDNDLEEKSFKANIHVYVINTAIKTRFRVGLMILDEIDAYYSDERIAWIRSCQYQFLLGLSATYKDEMNQRHLIMDTICPVVDEINEEEALANNYISKFFEYNLSCELTKNEQSNYEHYSKIIGDNMNKFGKRNPLVLAGYCLSGNKKEGKGNMEYCFMWAGRMGWTRDLDLSIQKNRELNEMWSPNKIVGYAKTLMEAIRERKDILYNAENKLRLAVDIINKYPRLKTICFSQSTTFADKLAKKINENVFTTGKVVVYHSKLETIKELNDKGKLIKIGAVRLKRRAVDAIKSGNARIISTASALDKGFNVKDIRLGITTSSTQNPTQHKQRGGRVKRIESYTEDITVLIVNIYAKDTQDEAWLIKRQSKSKNKVYWVDEVSRITYEPQPRGFEIKNL